MDIKKLQRVIVDALEDVKAQDIKVFDTTGQTQLFDRVIVASGTSNRQTRALASNVRDKVKEAGGHVISVEGEEPVDAGSSLLIMTLGAEKGAVVTIQSDNAEAVEAIAALVEKDLDAE